MEDFDFEADDQEDLKLQIADFYEMYGSKPDVEINDDHIIVTLPAQVVKRLKEDDPRNYATYYYGLVCTCKAKDMLDEAFDIGLKGLKYSIEHPENTGVRAALRDLTVSIAHKITHRKNIQPIIDAIKEDLEEKLELPLEIFQDNRMALAGKLEYGPQYGLDKHILYYNKKRKTVLHTILHELMHLEMNNEAAQKGKNMILFFSEAQYDQFLKRYSAHIKDLKHNKVIMLNRQVRRLFERYNLCLVNTALDLFVEWRIYQKYSTLRPVQFEALMEQNTLNLYAFQGGMNPLPEEILSNVKICNMISAMLLCELYGYDTIDEYKPSKYERTLAKDLFDEFLSYVNGHLNPGDEYSYVDYFISVCKAEDYVLMENEEDFVQALKKTNKEKKIKKANEEFRLEHKDGEDPALTMKMAMYMLSALRYFERLYPREIKRIAYDIAMLGTMGIDPNKSGYKIDSIIGKEFSGYELLAYYYVSWAQVFPSQLKAQDLPFTKAYELALQMFADEKNR